MQSGCVHLVHVAIGTLFVDNILECHEVCLCVSSEACESRRLELRRGGGSRTLQEENCVILGGPSAVMTRQPGLFCANKFFFIIGKVNLYDGVRCQVEL